MKTLLNLPPLAGFAFALGMALAAPALAGEQGPRIVAAGGVVTEIAYALDERIASLALIQRACIRRRR